MHWKKKIRLTPLDVILMTLLAAAALYCVHRVRVDLQYKWQWGAIAQYLVRLDAEGWKTGSLMQGFLTTIKLSLWATALATVLGTFMGLLRISRGRFERLLAGTYVETVRNLPPLVLVFIVYFFVGDRIMAYFDMEQLVRSTSPGMQKTLAFFLTTPSRLSGFLAGLTTLVLYEAAYITEIVRAGIQSIERGQWEAARALGLTRFQQLRFVIMPQAFQRIIPPLGGQLISTIKDSAIVSVISIPELTFQGSELMSATYLTFEVWITVMALYFVLTFSCSLGIRHLEKIHHSY
jgi:polar amino acid transport system permease protein